MNRFLSKKSAPADDAPNTSGRDARRWKKGAGKKVQEEPKPQFDLSSALPSTDDFRTSLIMPNLSARFSMLRDQDDPASKIGKASDDSVLSPRRQSKLPDFGFTGARNLGDIAEVQSISSGAPRPWLERNHDSFASDDSNSADGASSMNGSVMTRARPVEGNNLFGGRQKVYKIPTSTSVKSLGKLVYEEDMSKSAFQKYKQAEREALAREQYDEDENSDSGSLPFGLASSSTDMAPPPHSRVEDSIRWNSISEPKRQPSAASSAASETGQDTVSTAGTSLASQPLTSPLKTQPPVKPMMPNAASLERSATKRRLYEQGLDQNMQEQQASALTRLNTIQRTRTMSGNKSPNLGTTQTNPANPSQDRTARQQQNPHPPQSPVNPLTTFDSINKPQSPISSPNTSHPQSPTFMPLNEFDETGILSSTVKPSDRGKATAMGAFNMPQGPYDEEQYVRRLQQLHHNIQGMQSEKVSELPRQTPSPPLARFDSARHPTEQSISVPEPRARSNSTPEQPEAALSPNAFSVFQKAAAQMRAQHQDSNPASPTGSIPDTHKTFFGDISASDDDEEDIISGYDRRGYPGSTGGRFRSTELENIQEYPAAHTTNVGFERIQEQDEEEEEILPPQPLRTLASKPSLADSAKGHFDFTPHEQAPPQTSPQVDEAPKALGGLIHQHLRNTSNVSSSAASAIGRDPSSHHLRMPSDQSSIYTSTIGHNDSMPNFNDQTKFGNRMYGSQNRMNNDYTNSNPWDLDDLDDGYRFGEAEAPKPLNAQAPRPEHRVLASAAPKVHTDATSQRSSATSNWQPDHKRELSAGTLEEREAFAMELAARQKAIQESMKAIVEVESRGSSPQPAQGSTFKAFGMLKSKASGDLAKPDSHGNKGIKMLGLGGAGGSSTSLSSMRKPSYASEDTKPADRKPSVSASPRPSFSQRTPPVGDQKTKGLYDMQRPRGDSEASRQGRMQMSRPSPPIGSHSAGPPPQVRSSSTSSSARAPSRQERLLSDAGIYPHESASRSASVRPNMSPMPSQEFARGEAKGSSHNTPRQSPTLVQKPMGSVEYTRPRGNSKSAGSSPTEAKPPIPPQLPNGLRLMPSNSSPAPLNAAFNQGSVPASRPSPLQSPPMGPLSPASFGPLSPSSIGSQTYVPTSKHQGSVLRKKTVQKSDIGEPVLISSTSNVDTIDLPPGASLRNGMEVTLPAGNPRRRQTKKLFGFGKEDREETTEQQQPRTQAPIKRYPSPGAPPPLPPTASGMQQPYGNTPIQGGRPGARAMRSDESMQRSQFPMQGMPQRQMMAEPGMF
ncbi:hypothetical protein K461DRAFT_283435 [Myriangium duriaei CBS 260.36]|uniref:Uncharacterized protein n=1 Tax=Myriangium duriaei CBS 260.36 TaxID=1168546 RepID=A0A9P4IPR6_9PEZI|nr:hypothetical protein K461DRAFT_283435 [Myriangium duriaei CBS 260.36]